MRCLCVLVLLISASLAQVQEPSDGDKNDSSSGNLNNDNRNNGPTDNNTDGNINNNNNNNINNINVGAFNTINNGDVNNVNNGNFNNIVNSGNRGSFNGGITNGNFNVNNNNLNNGGQRNMNNYNVGNPDFGNITRPCNTYDTDCIRRFFADHAHCKVAHGPVPEPLYRDQIISYVPRVNLTVTLRKVKLRGVSNGRIEEFYVNQDTDKVVIAIEFRGLTIQSNNTYFRIHRRSKEPIVVKDYSSVTYQSVIMTAVIPKIYNLQLERTVVFAFVNDPNPPYMFGPRFTQSKDPEVQATYAAFLTNPRANVGEILLTDAPYYPATFIQYNICDFGLKIL